MRLVDELVSLDVAAIAGIVESRSLNVGAHLHVHVAVGKATVFAVDVEVGLHLNLLRTDVLEFELAGVVDATVFVREALESGDWSAIGKSSALGHLPDVLANQVVGVREAEVDCDIHIVDNYGLGTLLSHSHLWHDVHYEDRIGAAAHTIEGESNLIFARLSIFVGRIRLGRGSAVAEVPLHSTAFRRGVLELQSRYVVEVGAILVALDGKREINILRREVLIVGGAFHTRRGYQCQNGYE